MPARVRTRAPAKRNKRKSGGLSRKVKRAIDAMIWQGMSRKEAASHAELADESMRQALLKPQVIQYYNEQLDVLRTGGRATALNRIVSLARKSDSEKVGLDAAKYLDSNGNSDRPQVNVGVQVNVRPGYVIRVGTDTEHVQQIAHQSGSACNVLDQRPDVLTGPSERDE